MSPAHSARWRYRAAASDGGAVSGEIDAESEREAVDALRRRDLWVVEIALAGEKSPALPRSGRAADQSNPLLARARQSWQSRWQSNDAELAVVMRAMATLLSAGVPLVRALGYAAQESATDDLRQAFGVVSDSVQRGESLSASMSAQTVFPGAFAPLIAAGESSGTLDVSLALLADHLERRAALRSKLQSALIYPTILAIASTVGVIVILLLVVPRFATLISDSGGTLPLSTRALIAVSAVVIKGWWMLLLSLVAIAAIVQQSLKSPASRRRLDERILRWPIVGRLFRMRDAASYAGTLAVGLRAGVPLLGSMALARAVVRNRFLQTALAEAEGQVHGGVSLATATRGLLPPLAERLFEAGETSGDLAGMAARAAEASDAELQRSVTQAVALVEPAMILGFGGIVGFVALALLQAIYGLNASVL